MMFNLKGRVVVVSGASSGLGAQMAEGFAKQGADLVISGNVPHSSGLSSSHDHSCTSGRI